MKISDLLDEIFFKNGNKKFLPIAVPFAGDENAEIFGISENASTEETRVLATASESLGKGLKLHVYLGDSSGDCVKICNGTFTREQVLYLYYRILLSDVTLDRASNTDLKEAASYVTDIARQILTEEKPKQKGE